MLKARNRYKQRLSEVKKRSIGYLKENKWVFKGEKMGMKGEKMGMPFHPQNVV